MKIEQKEITVNELTAGYMDSGEQGVFGYGGKLDIRPPYQREFIYKEKQRNAVIETIQNAFPLNVMYWATRDDGTYEVIDGQQRTISISQFVAGEFSYNGLYFHNLPGDKQTAILNYKLMVYLCSGTDSEKLGWFRTINIAGEKLTNQELRNAVYAGSWVSNAKRYFSKNGCPAYHKGKNYMSGSSIRQDYLETAISWYSNGDIEQYMAQNQHIQTAVALWNYFQSVTSWIGATFINTRSQMKSVNWGELYNEFKDANLDPIKLEHEISELFMDDDVTKKSGIYPYVLTRNEKYLNIRQFTPAMRQKVYQMQKGICVSCYEKFKIGEMDADHITPWIAGGKTNEDNCQMLCKTCNRTKGAR